jgi:hypothetical protein
MEFKEYKSKRNLAACFRGNVLDGTLRQHDVGDTQEGRDIGAGVEVAPRVELFGRTA